MLNDFNALRPKCVYCNNTQFLSQNNCICALEQSKLFLTNFHLFSNVFVVPTEQSKLFLTNFHLFSDVFVIPTECHYDLLQILRTPLKQGLRGGKSNFQGSFNLNFHRRLKERNRHCFHCILHCSLPDLPNSFG